MIEAYLPTLAGVVLAHLAPGPNFVAVATFPFGAGLNGWQVAALGALAALSAATIFGSYGLLFSNGFAIRIYGRFCRWIEFGFASIFGIPGGKLLPGFWRELRA